MPQNLTEKIFGRPAFSGTGSLDDYFPATSFEMLPESTRPDVRDQRLANAKGFCQCKTGYFHTLQPFNFSNLIFRQFIHWVVGSLHGWNFVGIFWPNAVKRNPLSHSILNTIIVVVFMCSILKVEWVNTNRIPAYDVSNYWSIYKLTLHDQKSEYVRPVVFSSYRKLSVPSSTASSFPRPAITTVPDFNLRPKSSLIDFRDSICRFRFYIHSYTIANIRSLGN